MRSLEAPAPVVLVGVRALGGIAVTAYGAHDPEAPPTIETPMTSTPLRTGATRRPAPPPADLDVVRRGEERAVTVGACVVRDAFPSRLGAGLAAAW